MSVDFDGINDYIDCGSGATLDNLPAGNMSVACWIRADTVAGANRILDKRGAGGAGWTFAQDSTVSQMQFYIDWSGGDGAWRSPNNSHSTGVWEHWVVTYNGSSTTNDPVFYKNGVLVATTEVLPPTTTRVDDAAVALLIGGLAAGDWLNGQLEDVRICNRIWSVEEIAVLASGYRGPLGGEVVWLSCNDFLAVAHPDGTTLTVGTNNLPDLSGNGNDGAPTNGVIARASEAPRMSPWAAWLYDFGGQAYSATLTGAIGAASLVGTITKAGAKSLTGAIGAGSLVGTITKAGAKALTGAIASLVGTFSSEFARAIKSPYAVALRRRMPIAHQPDAAALGSAVDMLMLRNQSEPDNRLILRGYSDENLNVRSQSVSKLTSAALKRPIARAHIA